MTADHAKLVDEIDWLRAALTEEHRVGKAIAVQLSKTQSELRVTDELLTDRQRILDAIPECPEHGPCVPHALEWIGQAKAIVSAARDFVVARHGIVGCVGYPECDGDLVGQPHTPACPCFGVDMKARYLAYCDAKDVLLETVEIRRGAA